MLKNLIEASKDILYPKSCHACLKILNKTNSFDDYLCWDCLSTMKKTDIAFASMGNEQMPYQRLLSCYIYEGSVKELIHQFKYENRPYLSKTIARLMKEALGEYGQTLFKEVDCLLPIPLHPVRQREREFNQSELIAKELSSAFDKPICLVLKRIKNTKAQTSLKKTERMSNIKDAFAVTTPTCITGQHVLVIDDVVTTTATIKEVCSVLRNSGARNISVLTFAKG